MRVYTITFHCAHNYGAMLQAFALQNYLIKEGYESKIIDFRPLKFREAYEIKIFSRNFSAKKTVVNLLTYFIRFKKYKKFNEFMNRYLQLTEKTYYTVEELNNNFPQCDIVISGSDQVWNPEISLLEPYYLDFGDNIVKKVSYAASFGVSEIDKKYTDTIKKYISNVNEISVREIQGKNIVEQLCNKKAEVVLDPVFLLDEKEWEELIIKPRLKKKYVLIYSLEINNQLINVATKIANKENLEIIILNPTSSLKSIIKSRVYKGKKIMGVGPQEYLGLIKYAEFVVTNSFHGTAFSLIFNKNFITVPHTTRNSRIESILTIFDMKEHLLFEREIEIENILKKARYRNGELALNMEKEIRNSKYFLKKITL